MVNKFENQRTEVMTAIKELFKSKSWDVLRTGSQELCLPIVNEDGEEGYLKMVFSIPKGTQDGEPYDGYEMAQEYERKVEAAKAKAAEKAKAKAAKIAKDEKYRKAQAEAKAKREAEKAQ